MITYALSVSNAVKTYGHGPAAVQALRGVSLNVSPGESIAIMGASGSGKSTLLTLMGGLDSPTEGTVRLSGQELGALPEHQRTLLRRRQIGFVFQSFNLVSVLTAQENVALPLTLAGIAADEAARRSRRALELVGLADRAAHLPAELSGGQQQRVAVARALVTEPALILADEPTGNLDSRTGQELLALLRRSCDDLGQAVVMVTHDAGAAAWADRVLVLADGLVVEERATGRAGVGTGAGTEGGVTRHA
jgi:putative ABC transport system ATP-binding protein